MSVAGTSTQYNFEHTNYIIKKIGQGFFAIVYASIPKAIAGPLLAAYKTTPKCPVHFEDLVTNLQAFCEASKLSRTGIYLNDEVAILKAIKKHPQPNLISITHHEDSDSITWFSQNLLRGKPLESLIETYNTGSTNILPRLPTAFAWHVIASLCKALLYLHYGLVKNGTMQNESWAPCAHNDIHPGNILFDNKHSEKSFHDYPQIVLIDFGNSIQLPSTADDAEVLDVRCKQRRDVRNFLINLTPIINRVDKPDPDLSSVPDLLSGLSATDHNHIKKILISLLATAEKKREENYQPLPTQLREYFAQPIVSTEDIAKAFELS